MPEMWRYELTVAAYLVDMGAPKAAAAWQRRALGGHFRHQVLPGLFLMVGANAWALALVLVMLRWQHVALRWD